MIKKLLFIAVLCSAVSVQAQQAVGQWKLYPTKSTTPGVIYESTGDEVFYISGANLFSFDKNTTEIETYNTGNYLSDSGIKNIYYNYDSDYLMIVYNNSNIDLIDNNRDVVNIPDLNNTIMMSSKAINDVAFGDDKIYMATDFGLVVLNDQKYEVYESYIYNVSFSKITKAGNRLLAVVDNNVYIANIQSGMYNFGTYWIKIDLNEIGDFSNVNYLYALDEKHVLFATNANTYILDLENSTITLQTTNVCHAKSITPTLTGYMTFFDDKIFMISKEVSSDNKMQVSEVKTITNNNAKKGYYSSYNSNNSIWACTASGVSHFDIQGSTFTWLVEPAGYNTSSVSRPQSVQVHNNKVYVKNMGPYSHSTEMYGATTISVLDLMTYDWSVLSLDKVVLGGNSASKGALRSSYNLAFDPDSSDVFYTGSWFDGVHKFNGTKYVGNYNTTNSPLQLNWSMNACFSDIDTDGNLWFILSNNQIGKNPVLACLPADKKSKDPASLQVSDWITYDVGAPIEYKNYLLVCKKSPYVFVVHGPTVSPTRITVVNRNTGESRVFNTFIDQDGGSFGNGVLNFLVAEEDKNGNVWIGTTSGPIVLNNISNIMNSNYRCTRIKVPRNDGTDFADYLLEDESINSIVVDGANRKWLGTGSSGVYLVSPDGTEILEQHDVVNSLLPSNLVYAMDMSEATGELFVATDLGVASYRSDVSEVAENYDNVKVFPNPVRPDYAGWITIQGLMENSLVKITDVAGNLFNEGYANGGTYAWDGRTSDGERVKTGVYLIYASQSGGKSGVVAKVMVVN